MCPRGFEPHSWQKCSIPSKWINCFLTTVHGEQNSISNKFQISNTPNNLILRQLGKSLIQHKFITAKDDFYMFKMRFFNQDGRVAKALDLDPMDICPRGFEPHSWQKYGIISSKVHNSLLMTVKGDRKKKKFTELKCSIL